MEGPSLGRPTTDCSSASFSSSLRREGSICTSRVMLTLQIGVSYRDYEHDDGASADYRALVRSRVEIRCMTHSVFVYGTLKKGFWNNPLLKGCEFFGSAVTVPTA
jgi:hypothetical protein